MLELGGFIKKIMTTLCDKLQYYISHIPVYRLNIFLLTLSILVKSITYAIK